MGQKVHPKGLRLGINQDWSSKWYAGHNKFAVLLREDYDVRQYLNRKLKNAGVNLIQIERDHTFFKIRVSAARPGVAIGKKGSGVEDLEKDIKKLVRSGDVRISMEEVRKPKLSALLQAQSIAEQLEKRSAFRRVAKKAIQDSLQAGALGVKVSVSGRLGGTDIARCESFREGSVPLHTLRSDIDYSTYEASTTYGIIGVKVWIFKGYI